MVLESTVVCVDNSEYMRNGDFVPSRLHAQQDAVNLVCQSKTRSNPENNVGLITLSDETEVLVTLTTDVARVLSKLHQTAPKGNINFLCGVKVAHLVLKHRQGKNHRMRIIIFVASPIQDPEKELVKYGKRLRKEKVNVDVVNFGEEQANTEKLSSFINAINGTDAVSGSHLVTVPPGPLLSDTLMTSPILVGEDGQVVVRAGGGSFEFGIDPNEDPELALALRVSMEEQRAEQEARRNINPSPQPPLQEESNEEVMLKQALEMSMQVDDVTTTTAPATPTTATTAATVVGGSGGGVVGRDVSMMNEEEQMAYALQMSMEVQDAQATSSAAAAVPPSKQQGGEERMEEDDVAEAINDPDFLRTVLQGLPGVDADSEAVKKAMEEVKKKKKEEDGKKKQ